MLKSCTRQGKGNDGLFYERSPRICAAGVCNSSENVAECLNYYSLQDEVESLTRDAIIPETQPLPPGPVVFKPEPDMRNAGPFSSSSDLINPPVKTKFQTLVEDFKDTVYSSYWKKMVGSVPDPVPLLPQGFDIYGTTLGKKHLQENTFYDNVLMPINPVPDKTPAASEPGYQTSRKYYDSFNPKQTFGRPTNVDQRGIWMKCCLTDDKIVTGTCNGPIPSRQADHRFANMSQLGVPLEPNDNTSCVPLGHTFGITSRVPDNIPECLTTCELNPQRDYFKKCLGHLNTIRKCLKKRFDDAFFKSLYLKIKYNDKNKTGWLPKEIVYDFCSRRFIRFESSLLESLLQDWNGFDGIRVKYGLLIDILNHTIPLPDLPKVWDIPDDCIDFRTTYSEMVKLGQDPGKILRAGLPSGRYFDTNYPVTPSKCCKAHRAYLPEESDAKACLTPSVFTLLGVSHRDMYAQRAPEVIRRVFEASGETITDETFEAAWNEAKKYHSKDWVSYETFRRALNKINGKNNYKKEEKIGNIII